MDTQDVKLIASMEKAGHGPVTRIGNIKITPVIEGSTATYNKATGWLSVSFSSIPNEVTRAELKRHGFRYEPYSKRWRASFTTDREDLLRHYSGSVEQIDIKPNYAAKAEHMAQMAAKHEAKSQETFNQAQKMAEVIPFGQPILVGHHSEKADRSYRERIFNKYDRAREESEKASHYQDRAERFGKMATGENPVTIYNRIKKLEAEKRLMERRLEAGKTKTGTMYHEGNVSQARQDEMKRWIEHYNSRLTVEREKYTASGGIATERVALKEGDRIQTRWGTATLKKLSKNTARVAFDDERVSIYGSSKDSKIAVTDIVGKVPTSSLVRTQT